MVSSYYASILQIIETSLLLLLDEHFRLMIPYSDKRY